jgi:hypothetical protein
MVQVRQLFMENLPHHVCDMFDCVYLMNGGT